MSAGGIPGTVYSIGVFTTWIRPGIVLYTVPGIPPVFFDEEMEKLEKKRNTKRRTLFEAQDEIDSRKEGLIEGVEARLRQLVSTSELFAIRWRVK